MTRRADMLYQVQLAVLNVEQSIEQHAALALDQIRFEAQKAHLHIHHLGELFKAQDAFAKRKEMKWERN